MTKELLNVHGLIRRVRRLADLSQRDLAARVGVDQSVVARWESGEREPTVTQFALLVGLAGASLEVVGEAGDLLEPMTDEAPTDGQRRRYPAHLDLEERTDLIPSEGRLVAWRRTRRDKRRASAGCVPLDHPTARELERRRREARAARLERQRAWMAARPRRPADEPEVCFCPVACGDEGPHCVGDCPCACGPRLTRSERAAQGVEALLEGRDARGELVGGGG